MTQPPTDQGEFPQLPDLETPQAQLLAKAYEFGEHDVRNGCLVPLLESLNALIAREREAAAKEARQRSVQEFTGWMDAAIHTRLAHIKTTRGKIKTDPGFKRDLSKFVEEEADAFLDTPNQQERQA